MELQSQVAPVYLPEAEQQSVLRMGLQTLHPANWIQLDEDYLQFLRHKKEQYESNPTDVYDQLEGSQACIDEFNEYLVQHLLEHHSSVYELCNDCLRHIPTNIEFDIPGRTLWDASLWIQEDICLLQQIADSYKLTAASLCSPSNWKLQDKLGKNLDFIHQPVPNYDIELASRVNKLFAGLKAGKGFQRYNWSVQLGSELNWQDKYQEENANNTLYWRVERQSLIRLPRTEAIVFGIRIYLHDFATMAREPGFISNLRELIARQSPETRAYKNLNKQLLERLQSE